jgi:glycosyltransferase involved in cell wall biosynthesis
MMRVLSILPFSPPSPVFGGAERQMHALHQGLVARGIAVDVLADLQHVGADFQLIDGVSVWGVPFPTLTSHPFRPGNLRLWSDWRRLRATALSRVPRPDLIQVTTFRQPALYGYWLSHTLRVPWVVRLAGSGEDGDFAFSMQNWLTRSLMRRMVASVSRVTALDRTTREEAVAYGVPPARVRVISNGLALARIPPPRQPDPAIATTVLYLGRLADRKDVDTLVTAWARVCRTISRNDPQLVIAGDGETRGRLQDTAIRLGIAERCRFLGAVSHPEEPLGAADLFVNPSRSEGLPNAVLEAAACGLPLVLSDIPIHREIACSVGMADYLFPVGDVQALAERLISLLRLDPAARAVYGRRCAEFGKRFLPEARDQAYVDLYRELLGAL